MSNVKDTSTFVAKGSPLQYQYVLELYPHVIKLKAERKNKKPQELIKLDDWYQNELPKKIKSRGKDAHITHEELVQAMKWKLSRGKFSPQLSNLVKINTPKAVYTESKKAFRKLPNLEQAMTALNNLKGVGITMASALLAAACPESAPFMADECLMAIPEIEGIDYTAKEYLNFVQHIHAVVNRLNSSSDGANKWNAHKVELALWTHYVAAELQPELLEDIPSSCENGDVADGAKNGDANKRQEDDSQIRRVEDESDDTTDSLVPPNSTCISEDTNDSIPAATAPPDDESSASVPDDEDEDSQPATKKIRVDK